MKKYLLMMFVLFYTFNEVQAQSNLVGSIKISVTDDSTSQPLKGVYVYFMNAMGSVVKSEQTSSTGQFIMKLSVGVYYVYFKSERYLAEYYDNVATFQYAKPIEVKSNDTISIKASLKLYTPIVALVAPKNLKASQVSHNYGNMVLLTWTGSTTTPQPYYIQYNIYRSAVSPATPVSFKKITKAYGASYYDKSIVNGETYKYYLTATSYDFESASSETVSVSIKDSLFIGKGVIKGVVVDDSTLLPIQKAMIAVVPVNNSNCNGIETSTNGSFSLPLYAGSYYLYAKANEYNFEYYDNVTSLTSATKFDVKNNDTIIIKIGLKKLKPIPQVTFSGVVQDTTGKGQRSEVYVYRVKLNSKHWFTSVAKTDSFGKFSMKVNLGDTVIVYVRPFEKSLLPEYFENKSTFNDATRIPVTKDQSFTIVVNKKPVFANGMNGMVKDSANKPATSSIAAIMLHGSSIRKTYSTISDSLGVYGFTNMEPGKYILFAKPVGSNKPTYYRSDGKQTLDWKKADTLVMSTNSILANLNFKLVGQSDTGHATIAGFIKNKNNLPVEGVTVFVLDENSDPYSYAITNSKGYYVMNTLEAGTYKITTDMVGYESATLPNIIVNYNSVLAMSNTGSIIINPIILSVSDKNIIASSFVLSQNYPNPFNPSTTIQYSVPFTSDVRIAVYDLIGREVSLLTNKRHNAGNYSINFEAVNLPTGIYIYQLQGGGKTISRKLILLK